MNCLYLGDFDFSSFEDKPDSAADETKAEQESPHLFVGTLRQWTVVRASSRDYTVPRTMIRVSLVVYEGFTSDLYLEPLILLDTNAVHFEDEDGPEDDQADSGDHEPDL